MISIIIPAYNDEKFIARCLDSICAQTYIDYEVLLVLDGSSDGTKSAAERYIGKLNRLRIIEQENSGSGRARNNGIEHSSGEFITFVDADDWLEPNALQVLIDIESRTGSDYIVANPIIVEKKKNGSARRRYVGHTEDCFVETIDEVSKTFFSLDYDGSSHAPWGKLYKASIIKQHNIRFPDLRRSQDIVFNNIYARYITSIYVSDKYVYNFWNTIYAKSIYRDKQNRRNTPLFIDAEKNHLGTMSIVASAFYETLDFRGYKLSTTDKQKKNDDYLKGIYNNIAANVKRDKKNALYALDKYCMNPYFLEAIKSPKNVMIVYKIIAFLLRHKWHLSASIVVLFCENINSFFKHLN